MRLINITLNPFAGFLNKTVSFNDGVNVVFGKNEAGKSTLIKALKMILFDSTFQTPAAGKKLLKDVLPVDGGDTVGVSLEFEHEGDTYHLIKKWGAAPSCSFHKANQAPITEPGRVQSELNNILKQNRLVWESVMIASQAQIPDTHTFLEKNKDVSTDLDRILQNAVMNNLGVAPEKITEEIEVQLNSLCTHWNLDLDKPLIGNTGKGSYDNRYNNPGEILSLDYQLFDKRIKLETRKKYDERLDEKVRNLESKNAQLEEVSQFVEKYKNKIDGYRKLSSLNYQKSRLENENNTLETDCNAWSSASSQLELLRQNGARDRVEKESIDKELQVANTKNNSGFIVSNKNNIDQLLQQKDRIMAVQQGYKCIRREDKLQLDNMQAELNGEKVRFDALSNMQGFHVELTASNNISIDLTQQKTGRQTIDLFTASPYEFDANGSFELKSHELHLKVIASIDNLRNTEIRIAELESALQRIVAEYDAESVEALLESDKQWQKCETEIINLDRDIKGKLGAETFETLAARVQALNELPECRSVETLTKLQGEAAERLAESIAAYRAKESIQKNYQEKYTTLDRLKSIQLDKLIELRQVNDAISQLAEMPEDNKTSEELIALYDQKKEILDLLKSEINDLNIEKIKLESEHDNCSALEYEEEIQILTLQKEQKIRKAKDLTRIQEKLNEIINRAPADPYEGYYNKMRSYMNTLTVGKYQDLAIDDALPTAIVQQNNRHIGLDLLSQGTSTLLGIALRLSMADYFLGERGGFLVFDDPMTDLDESRQQATANCFLEYATENHRQVLVFTCHESHANQLAGNRIELN